MLQTAVHTATYLGQKQDASMELFKEIETLRGKFFASHSTETAQAEAEVISQLLFVRFLSDSGFFGESDFSFESLTNQTSFSHSAPLHFLDEQLTPSWLSHDPINGDALRKLICEVMPRYNWAVASNASNPPPASKPVVKSWVLGYIYERWIDNRKTGSYFTADALAYSIVTLALEEWLDAQYQKTFGNPAPLHSALMTWKDDRSLEGTRLQETLAWLDHALEDIRIVDLSMGGGAFLVAATKALYHLTLFCRSFATQAITPADRASLLRRIFRQNLYGMDVMPAAIHIAKMRLWLLGLELDSAIVQSEPLPALPNLLHGDALTALTPLSSITQSSFLNDGAVESEAVQIRAFLTSRGGFDVCVGNPPFIALSQENHVPQKREFIEDWNKQHPEYALRTTSDLSNFFILRGSAVLRPDGVLAYITSRNFFDTRYGEPIRKFLAREVELRYLFTLHDHPFTQQGLKVKANTVILSLIRRLPVVPIRFQDLTFWNESLSDQVCREVRREELYQSSNWTQTLFTDPLRADLLLRCDKKLSDYASARMGIKSGSNAFFLFRSDSDLFAELSKEESAEVFAKIVKNSREISGFVLPADTPYRLLNLREKITSVEHGFSTPNRLRGIAKHIYHSGVAYSCPHCQALAMKEHDHHPDRYPHRGMCAKCPKCRQEGNRCDRPVDRLSNQGHRPAWYTLTLGALPAIAVQCIVDTDIGVFWNSANVYATDQFQTIGKCPNEETTKLLFAFLCSRIARLFLEGSALHRARFDGSFMLKVQVNHLNDLPCPDFGRISPMQKKKLLQLFDRLIATNDRKSEKANQLMDEIDRIFLALLGYPGDSIDAIQVQLRATLENAVLFRWTKTRSRSNTLQPHNEENDGDLTGGIESTDLGVPSIGALDSNQEPTRAPGK